MRKHLHAYISVGPFVTQRRHSTTGFGDLRPYVRRRWHFFTRRLTFSDINWRRSWFVEPAAGVRQYQDGRTSTAPTMKVPVMSSNAPDAPEPSNCRDAHLGGTRGTKRRLSPRF